MSIECFPGLCCTFGAHQAAALNELGSLGLTDAAMVADPEISFFRSDAEQHTNFSIEAACRNVTGAGFGTTFSICLEKGPDMMMAPVLEITVPQLSHEVYEFPVDPSMFAYQRTGGSTDEQCTNAFSCDGSVPQVIKDLYGCSGEPTDTDFQLCSGEVLPPHWVSWVQGLAMSLFECIQFKMGHTQVDEYAPENTYAFEEVLGMSCKDIYLMTGVRKSLHELILASYMDVTTLYLPLMFYMRIASLALPMGGLIYSPVEFAFQTKPLNQLIIIRSSDKVRAVRADGQCLGDSDLSIRLITHNIYLDKEERAFINNVDEGAGYEVVVRLHKRITLVLNNQKSVLFQAEFNHPVTAFVMTVQDMRQRRVGNYFNFAGLYGQPILKTWSLTFAGSSRFSQDEGYFRLVQPYIFSTRTTDAYVYLYSFGTNAGSLDQFTGSANLARIANPMMQVVLRDEYKTNSNIRVVVNAIYFNVVDYELGSGGTKFT